MALQNSRRRKFTLSGPRALPLTGHNHALGVTYAATHPVCGFHRMIMERANQHISRTETGRLSCRCLSLRKTLSRGLAVERRVGTGETVRGAGTCCPQGQEHVLAVQDSCARLGASGLRACWQRRPPMSRDIPESAVDIARLVASGAIGAGDALARSLDRIQRDNARLNAIIRLNPAAAAEVDQVQRRLNAGAVMPLAGVPVVIKDNLWVAGMTITQGAQLFADFVAQQDCVAVARLRAAGAIILGIGATSEFACLGVTNTPLYGMTRNPVDPALTPGGSSGGPSAAVAAGFAPLALGTDAGGSTRRPPAHVGVIGFKPGQDVVPYGPGFDEPVLGVSVICPIARNMQDIALSMRVLSGLSVPSQTCRPALAYAAHFGLDQPLDDDVARVTDRAVDRIRRAGYAVDIAAPVWPARSGRADVAALQWAGLAALYGDAFRSDPTQFGTGIADQINRGLGLTGVEVVQAHQASHRMGETLRAFLARHSFLMTPTTPCPAWPVEDVAPRIIGGLPASPRDHAAFTSQANHAGAPAITLPCGHTGTGLPLGLQVMAAPGADAALLALAQDLEPILAGSA